MEEHTVDRRVLRTHQALREALFALIEERGYEDLSVQEITERANVGRATFYGHYHNKEELLLMSVKDLLEDFQRRMQPLLTFDVVAQQQSLSVLVFQHIFEHASIYRVVLSEHGATGILAHLRVDVAALMQQLIIDPLVANAATSVPADMLAEYCSEALRGLIGWWLRNNFPLPAEEMGHLTWQLISHGLLKTLEITQL